MSRDIHEPCGYVYGSDGCQAECGEPAYPLDPAKLRTLLERVRAERDAAEQQAARMETIVAALVRKFGEAVRLDEAWRVALTESELITAQSGHLRIMMDPNSGAMLLRYELPL